MVMNIMSEAELKACAKEFHGSDIGELPRAEIDHKVTISQYVTDICINELEKRGELTLEKGRVCVPYISFHFVDTVLTRDLEELDE
jgi:hypothetical protein